MKCLMLTADNTGNKACQAALKKPEQKVCPEGCVDTFKKAGVCARWDDESFMMEMEGPMLEKCATDACERALATACFGECDKSCLKPWVENGGCAVFDEKASQEMDPMDFMDKEMNDG